MSKKSQPNDDRERTDPKKLSDEDLDAVSGGMGLPIPQPTSGERKRQTVGSTVGDGASGTDGTTEENITTANGIVIEVEDDNGSSTSPVSSSETTPPPDGEDQTDTNVIKTRSGAIKMDFEDDNGYSNENTSSDQASGQDDSADDDTEGSTSPVSASETAPPPDGEDQTDTNVIKTRSGAIKMDFEDDNEYSNENTSSDQASGQDDSADNDTEGSTSPVSASETAPPPDGEDQTDTNVIKTRSGAIKMDFEDDA